MGSDNLPMGKSKKNDIHVEFEKLLILHSENLNNRVIKIN